MKLYYYLIKAVQEYIENACPEKMGDEEVFETLYYVKKLRSCLTDEIGLHVADYIINRMLKEGSRRGGLVFFNLTTVGDVDFASSGTREMFEAIPRNARKKLITGALDTAEKRGVKFEKGARGKIRKYLLSL